MIRRISDRLILIGTAHILPKSVGEVKETIQSENPEVVGVELCRARYLALTTKKEDWKGRGRGEKPAGLSGILQYLQDRFAQRTGSPAGEEMLTAIESSREVGARIELIDRDISITLQRFMSKLGFWGKLKLTFEAFLSVLPFGKKIDLENITEEEVVERLIEELKDFSKPAYEVLIHERNQYMVERITELMKSSSGKIVCVVGAGHVPGLQKELKSRIEASEFEPWESFKLEMG